MTEPGLLQFFDDVFGPTVLLDRRGASGGTIMAYRQSVAWWDQLMPAGALSTAGKAEVEEFARLLSAAAYRLGDGRIERQFSPSTVAKIVSLVRVVLAAQQTQSLPAEQEDR